jgi:hypothetical protein
LPSWLNAITGVSQTRLHARRQKGKSSRWIGRDYLVETGLVGDDIDKFLGPIRHQLAAERGLAQIAADQDHTRAPLSAISCCQDAATACLRLYRVPSIRLRNKPAVGAIILETVAAAPLSLGAALARRLNTECLAIVSSPQFAAGRRWACRSQGMQPAPWRICSVRTENGLLAL